MDLLEDDVDHEAHPPYRIEATLEQAVSEPVIATLILGMELDGER